MSTQGKIIVRYFFVPICPEALATEQRLRELFANRGEFRLETYNLVSDRLESPEPWFPAEEELLKTCRGEGDVPLLYGRLYFAGEEVPGFPPSGKRIAELFSRYGIPFPADGYSIPYAASPNRRKWEEYTGHTVEIRNYSAENLLPACRICTAHHPYIAPEHYCPKDWNRHEQEKISYLQEKLDANRLIGVIACYGDEPAGFAEAVPLSEAIRLGFPVSAPNPKELMVTCLSVRTEAAGRGLGRQLLLRLEKEARAGGFTSVEVMTFPDHRNWQPRSLYEKLGYHELKTLRGEYVLMKKKL